MLSAWLGLMACSESGFHTTTDADGSDSESSRPTDSGDPGTTFYEPGDTDDDTGGWEPEPQDTAPPVHLPESCSVDTMVHLAGTGPQDCPDDYAVFMMDDGDGPNMVCCPLPADDILVDALPVSRGSSCGSNEVITGFDSAYAFRCTTVNVGRYTVGSAAEPCYFGDGWSGGWGVDSCSAHPHTWDVVQTNLFGSDGCSGYPYGSLFVSQGGSDCDDMRASQILYNGSVNGDPPAGTPVEMFSN